MSTVGALVLLNRIPHCGSVVLCGIAAPILLPSPSHVHTHACCSFCWAQMSKPHTVSDLRLAAGLRGAGSPRHCLTPGGLQGIPRVLANSLPQSYAGARLICKRQQQHVSTLSSCGCRGNS